MTSRSNPDWLAKLIAEEGDAKLIEAHERDSILEALGAAADPQPLDAQRHQRLIENALAGGSNAGIESSDDPLAPVTDEETAAAAKTRERLETDPLVALLRSAYRPDSLAPESDMVIRSAALVRTSSPARSKPSVTKMVYWSTFAAAAAAALWLSIPRISQRTESVLDEGFHSELAQSRTTKPLFSMSFASSTPSERIDRIAQVRERELRNNRYVLWGLP
jgi:hypothetical protein